MHTHTAHLIQARGLLADIQRAPGAYLPRREALVRWLGEFLVRAQRPAYRLGNTEVDDLNSVHQFLRTENVPVAGRPRI